MAATVWKGHITFGLVSIPVKLHRAARAERVSFRQLHQPTGTRLRQTYVRQDEEEEPARPQRNEFRAGSGAARMAPVPISESPRAPQREAETDAPQPESREVARSEIAKGYEYAKDRYVMLTREDLEKITPKTAREMQIQEFVRLEEVDPIYFETSYYVTPDRGGERAYALLYQALRRTKYVAVAQMAMHNREHVVLIRPGHSGLVLHTMFYENEVRRQDEYDAGSEALPKEIELATMLVENLAAPFEPGKYRDTYREKVEELIRARIAGEEVIEAQAPDRAPVVNILEALQRSLQQTGTDRKPAARQEESTPPKKKRPGKKAG